VETNGKTGGDIRGAVATVRSFVGALLAGDPQTAPAHLAPAACLLTPDGTEVVGRAAAGGVLAQITSSAQELEISLGRTVVSGGLALSTPVWRRPPAGRGGGY